MRSKESETVSAVQKVDFEQDQVVKMRTNEGWVNQGEAVAL